MLTGPFGVSTSVERRYDREIRAVPGHVEQSICCSVRYQIAAVGMHRDAERIRGHASSIRIMRLLVVAGIRQDFRTCLPVHDDRSESVLLEGRSEIFTQSGRETEAVGKWLVGVLAATKRIVLNVDMTKVTPDPALPDTDL